VIIEDSQVEIHAIEYGNGLAFQSANITGSRGCIKKTIYDDKLCRDMSKKSRLLVEQKLKWKAIQLEYVDACECALHQQT